MYLPVMLEAQRNALHTSICYPLQAAPDTLATLSYVSKLRSASKWEGVAVSATWEVDAGTQPHKQQTAPAQRASSAPVTRGSKQSQAHNQAAPQLESEPSKSAAALGARAPEHEPLTFRIADVSQPSWEAHEPDFDAGRRGNESLFGTVRAASPPSGIWEGAPASPGSSVSLRPTPTHPRQVHSTHTFTPQPSGADKATASTLPAAPPTGVSHERSPPRPSSPAWQGAGTRVSEHRAESPARRQGGHAPRGQAETDTTRASNAGGDRDHSSYMEILQALRRGGVGASVRAELELESLYRSLQELRGAVLIAREATKLAEVGGRVYQGQHWGKQSNERHLSSCSARSELSGWGLQNFCQHTI
jgi:hypothetical protein